MLGELYQYALDHELIVRPGFKEKNVKYYLSFGKSGQFLGVQPAVSNPVMCPDIGSLANGTTKSNIVVEKAEVVLNIPDSDGNYKRGQKHEFYIASMKEAAQYDSLFAIAINALESNLEQIREEYVRNKRKRGDMVGLIVDGKALEESDGYLEWWEEFRRRFGKAASVETGKSRCFITGQLTVPMVTIPPVSGLISVGGHTKGDTLICFDKDAYRSYGFEQAANAAVSEFAMTGVNAALGKLLEKSKPLAGSKNIHWFSQKIEHDIIEALDFDFGFEVGTEGSGDAQDESIDEDEQKIKTLYDFLFTAEYPQNPQNRYYMMSLSGVNGRIMIRNYDEGSYDVLYQNIKIWYNDILISNVGYPKLWRIYSRLLKYSESEKKISERIAKELSGLAPKIEYSIFHNTPLPDETARRALAYIRSKMYASEEKHRVIDIAACQILKAWLNRKYRNEKKEELQIMEKLNKHSPSKAYQTGRLIAVYVALQNKALDGVNSGVAEKYYSSACTMPALVVGKLAQLSQYHLSKLNESGKVFYNKMLQEIAVKIGTEIPNTYSLEEQSQFALGYYFQNAEIYNSNKAKEDK